MSLDFYLMVKKLYAPFAIFQTASKLNVGSKARIRFTLYANSNGLVNDHV